MQHFNMALATFAGPTACRSIQRRSLSLNLMLPHSYSERHRTSTYSTAFGMPPQMVGARDACERHGTAPDSGSVLAAVSGWHPRHKEISVSASSAAPNVVAQLVERFNRLDGGKGTLAPQCIEIILSRFRWIFQSQAYPASRKLRVCSVTLIATISLTCVPISVTNCAKFCSARTGGPDACLTAERRRCLRADCIPLPVGSGKSAPRERDCLSCARRRRKTFTRAAEKVSARCRVRSRRAHPARENPAR